MPDTYEAICDDGRLEWLGNGPPGGRHRVVVTVIGDEAQPHDRADVRRMLEATRGAWGSDRPIEEVNDEIQRIRGEWDRVSRSA